MIKDKQEEKILNVPAEIYWFNESLFVIPSGLKNGLSGLKTASNDLRGQVAIKMASVSPF